MMVHMAYILVFDCMLQNMCKIGGNVKNCVILSKNALMTKLVTDGTRTILVQFTRVRYCDIATLFVWGILPILNDRGQSPVITYRLTRLRGYS